MRQIYDNKAVIVNAIMNEAVWSMRNNWGGGGKCFLTRCHFEIFCLFVEDENESEDSATAKIPSVMAQAQRLLLTVGVA